MPLGAFLPVAVAILELLRRGDAEAGDGLPTLRGAQLRILPKIADEDDLVDHDVNLSARKVARGGARN